jgi:hypothetical protein
MDEDAASDTEDNIWASFLAPPAMPPPPMMALPIVPATSIVIPAVVLPHTIATTAADVAGVPAVVAGGSSAEAPHAFIVAPRALAVAALDQPPDIVLDPQWLARAMQQPLAPQLRGRGRPNLGLEDAVRCSLNTAIEDARNAPPLPDLMIVPCLPREIAPLTQKQARASLYTLSEMVPAVFDHKLIAGYAVSKWPTYLGSLLSLIDHPNVSIDPEARVVFSDLIASPFVSAHLP